MDVYDLFEIRSCLDCVKDAIEELRSCLAEISNNGALVDVDDPANQFGSLCHRAEQLSNTLYLAEVDWAAFTGDIGSMKLVKEDE